MKNSQIDVLAKFIIAEFPESITEGGAGNVAIKIITNLRTQLEEAEGKIRPLTPAELNADAMLEILQCLDTEPECTCDLCVKTRAVLADVEGGG